MSKHAKHSRLLAYGVEGCLTTEVLGVQRLGGLEERVGQEGLVVGVHLLAVLIHLGAAGQVRPEGGQRYELHQLHVWDVAKTAVVGVCSAHLEVQSDCSDSVTVSPNSKPNPKALPCPPHIHLKPKDEVSEPV